MNLPEKLPVPDTQVSQVALFRAELAQVTQLAGQIPNNRELKRLLVKIPDLEMREAVYKLITPMLKFRVRAYKSLML